MKYWLFPANPKFYDVFAALAQAETYWPMTGKVSAGDRLYLYLAAPYKQIGYACDVLETDFAMDDIHAFVKPFLKGDGREKPQKAPKPFMKIKPVQKIELAQDSVLSYSSLKENGLNGMLMGPRKLENNPQLLNYINGVLS